MNNLINISENDSLGQVVSARELYEFLDIRTPFDKWMPRMLEYGFEEGIDFSTFLSESTGGRPSTNYALTLDTAKEISMVQRNDKGRQARRYFIECERNLNSLRKTLPELIYQIKEERMHLYSRIKDLDAAERYAKNTMPKLPYGNFKEHFTPEVISWLNENVDRWVKIGFIRVQEYFKSFPTDISRKMRVMCLREYCRINKIKVEISSQIRIRNERIRIHKFS